MTGPSTPPERRDGEWIPVLTHTESTNARYAAILTEKAAGAASAAGEHARHNPGQPPPPGMRRSTLTPISPQARGRVGRPVTGPAGNSGGLPEFTANGDDASEPDGPIAATDASGVSRLDAQQAGQPARTVGGVLPHEIIGPPGCPVMHRWELVKSRWGKLLVHHFLPNADDRAEHDHPAPFITVVVAGGYDDRVPCPNCSGKPPHRACDPPCDEGLVAGDRMRPGMIRRRDAEYRHRTQVLPSGCWTIVWMFPKTRPWGFWVAGTWWPWRDHEKRFGFGMRCPEPPQPPVDRAASAA